MKSAFVQPNGQAYIEKDFCVNKAMLIENLGADSLCTHLVFDAIKATNKEVHEIAFGSEILS